jgi:hypothetical protein
MLPLPAGKLAARNATGFPAEKRTTIVVRTRPAALFEILILRAG